MAVGAAPTTRVFHAHLLALWENFVVQVPEADGVHAMVTDEADAEDAARDAIATVLEIDPSGFTVVVDRF